MSWSWSAATTRHRSLGERDPFATREGSHGIVIVDPETLFAEAVARELEHAGLSPVMIRANSAQAAEAVDRSAGCVFLVDPQTEGASDDVVLAELGLDGAKVVLWSATLDHDRVTSAVALGYRGVVSKEVRLGRLVQVLRCVMEGDISIDVGELGATHGSVNDPGQRGMVALTSRERQVLALLAEGTDSGEIAARLSLSPHTVRTHINNVMQKLGVHSRAEAVAHAIGRRVVIAEPRHPVETR